MELHEMTQLIRTVWSDSMSDNGAIWKRSNAILQQARSDYPGLYLEAIEWLYSNKVGI
jgi:kynurenine formamidase